MEESLTAGVSFAIQANNEKKTELRRSDSNSLSSSNEYIPVFKYRGAIDKHEVNNLVDSDEEETTTVSNPIDLLQSKKKKRGKSKKNEPAKKKIRRSTVLEPDEDDSVSIFGSINTNHRTVGTKYGGNSFRPNEVVNLDEDQDESVPLETAVQHHPELMETFKTVRVNQELVSSLKNSQILLEDTETQNKEVSDNTVIINLRIRNPDKSLKDSKDIKFKIYLHDPFQKVLENYARFQGVQPERFSLKFDGITLPLQKAPQDFSMQDKDTIDVIIAPTDSFKSGSHSLGHGELDSSSTTTMTKSFSKSEILSEPTPVSDDSVKLKVRSGKDEPAKFRLGKTEPMKKLFQAYCTQQGLSFSKVKFTFDGRVIFPEQTPEDLEVEDGDLLDASIS